ncbi:MAG: hypothetical protein Q9217_005585, partial [Psora testacea]
HGIDPGINFSDLPAIRRVVEEITQIPVHPRAPYAGDFAFLALSGAHQDAIRKGFARREDENSALPNGAANGYTNGCDGMQKNSGRSGAQYGHTEPMLDGQAWRVPYLPLDPADVGITQADIIGINSQSGKSGILWILRHSLGLIPPKNLAIEFSRFIKDRSAKLNRQFLADEICELFLDQYCEQRHLNNESLSRQKIDALDQTINGLTPGHCQGEKMLNGLDAAQEEIALALGVQIRCLEHSSHVIDKTKSLAAFVECAVEDKGESHWGVGIGPNLRAAYALSLLSSVMANEKWLNGST